MWESVTPNSKSYFSLHSILQPRHRSNTQTTPQMKPRGQSQYNGSLLPKVAVRRQQHSLLRWWNGAVSEPKYSPSPVKTKNKQTKNKPTERLWLENFISTWPRMPRFWIGFLTGYQQYFSWNNGLTWEAIFQLIFECCKVEEGNTAPGNLFLAWFLFWFFKIIFYPG